MNKFNLTMSVAVVIALIFFGIGIIQKANYKISDGDLVVVSYSIIDGDKTFDSQKANVTIGSNDDKLITDDVLNGVKYGAELNFDKTLSEDLSIEKETTIKKGTDVKIKGKITSVTPVKASESSEANTTSEKSEQ